ncbi:MAG: SgcJ/EcaC family oxidoreductase [Alphaproteobacteria bacterium]|nr:SgcJ/EcaC family oxidoreductase [Alphaproteobacteria bacterium]
MSNSEIVTQFMRAWEAKDTDRIMSFFAADAVYHNMPMPAMKGVEEIRKFIAPFAGSADDVVFEVLNQAETAEGTVLNERVDRFTLKNGQKIAAEVMGVFELKGGKIVAWRDYFDMKAVQPQGG